MARSTNIGADLPAATSATHIDPEVPPVPPDALRGLVTAARQQVTMGRLGALAVALGIGAAIATCTAGAAAAEEGDSTSSSPSASTSTSGSESSPATARSSNPGTVSGPTTTKPSPVRDDAEPTAASTSGGSASVSAQVAKDRSPLTRSSTGTVRIGPQTITGSLPGAASGSSVTTNTAVKDPAPLAGATTASGEDSDDAGVPTGALVSRADAVVSGALSMLSHKSVAAAMANAPALWSSAAMAGSPNTNGATATVPDQDSTAATTATSIRQSPEASTTSSADVRADSAPVVATAATTTSASTVSASTASASAPSATTATTQTPPFFPGADWLWNPIASNAAVATDSATWVSYLSAAGTQHVADLYDYGVTLLSTSDITSTTPRYRVTFTEKWGSNPFGSYTVPIPKGTEIPPGSDGQIAILDPKTGQAFGIWQAKYNRKTNTWSGSWGGMTPINGNGIDTSGSTTATGIARYAGVITTAEFSAAVAANTGINHALAVSSNIAGPGFVGPAIKSDGTNLAGVAVPMPEGYRIQLDPSIDVDAIPGITPAEKVIAKTLQTYGAYVVDQGATALAFIFQKVPGSTSSNPGTAYTSAGLGWDYADMSNIPWTQLRVLSA